MISNKMVSIVIMVGGAIINATAFVGGRYLARVFDWWIWFRWREKPTRTRLVKIFHAAYEKYEENRTKLLDWISTNDRIKDEAKQNFRNTGYALKLYKKVHQEQIDLTEPQFSDFYQPSSAQKRGEIIYVGASALAIRLAASRFFLKWKTQSFRQFITVRTDFGRDWRLWKSWLKSPWRCSETLADETGHLADLFARSKEYTETNLWCSIT